MNILKTISSWLTKTPKQTSFLFCKCGHELLGTDMQNTSFKSDVYVENRNVVHYHCQKCSHDTYFDFDISMVPIEITDTDLIEKSKSKTQLVINLK